MSEAKTTLEKYLPEKSLPLIMELLRSEPVQLKIVRPRSTKFGDYRFPKGHDPRHRISLNSNLNPFAFLITLVHEMAHLKAFKEYGKRIKAHGPEWQKTYYHLTLAFIEAGIFPDDLRVHLQHSLIKGSASSCTDVNLYRILKRYDHKARSVLHLEDIKEGQLFQVNGTVLFRKGPKLRKRYRCKNLINGREYMVHPLAEVIPVESINPLKSA